MRALTTINSSFYTCGTLNDLGEHFDLLAMCGAFGKGSGDDIIATIYPYARGTKAYGGVPFDGDDVQLAIERMNDRCVELVLAHPDLEWADASDYCRAAATRGRGGGVDFMERALARYMLPSSPARVAGGTALEDVETPRIVNTVSFDSAMP